MPSLPFNVEDNIIKMLGVRSLTEEKRVRLVEQMTDLVQKRVILRLMEMVTEQDAAEAVRISDDPEALMAFLGSKADLAEVVDQEVRRLKNELRLNAHEDAPLLAT